MEDYVRRIVLPGMACSVSYGELKVLLFSSSGAQSQRLIDVLASEPELFLYRHGSSTMPQRCAKSVLDLARLGRSSFSLSDLDVLSSSTEQRLLVLQVPNDWLQYPDRLVPPEHVERLISDCRSSNVLLNIITEEQVLYYTGDAGAAEYSYLISTGGRVELIPVTSLVEDRSLVYEEPRPTEEPARSSVAKVPFSYRIYRPLSDDYRHSSAAFTDRASSAPRLLLALSHARVDVAQVHIPLTYYESGRPTVAPFWTYAIAAVADERPVVYVTHECTWTTLKEAAQSGALSIGWTKALLHAQSFEPSPKRNHLVRACLLQSHRTSYLHENGWVTSPQLHGCVAFGANEDRDFTPNAIHFVGRVGTWDCRASEVRGDRVILGRKQLQVHFDVVRRAADKLDRLKAEASTRYPQSRIIGLFAGPGNPASQQYIDEYIAEHRDDPDCGDLLVIDGPEIASLLAQDTTLRSPSGYKRWLLATIRAAEESRSRELGRPIQVRIVYRTGRVSDAELYLLNRLYSCSLQVYHAGVGASGSTYDAVALGTPVVATRVDDFIALRDELAALADSRSAIDAIECGIHLTRMIGIGVTQPDISEAADAVANIIWNYDTLGQKMSKLNLTAADLMQPHIVAARYDALRRSAMLFDEFGATLWDGKCTVGKEEAEQAAARRADLEVLRAQAADCVLRSLYASNSRRVD